MVIGGLELVAIAMALGVAAMLLRFLTGRRQSSTRFPVGMLFFLFVLWLCFSRQGLRQNHTPQSWVDQQRAVAAQNAAFARQVAKQHAEVAQHLAKSQAQTVEASAKKSVQVNSMKMDADFKLNRQWGNTPNAPTAPTAQAWATAQSSSSSDPFSWAGSALAPPAAPRAPAPVGSIMVLQPAEEKAQLATWIVLAPFLFGVAALIGLVAVRRVRHAGTGSGLGWLAAGVVVLVLVGFFFVGSTRTGEVVPGRVIADASTTRMQQIGGPFEVDTEAHDRESIDAIWERLSAPQIKLESEQPVVFVEKVEKVVHPTLELSPKQVTAAQTKLNEAAQVLELAAEGMNESNSQGWLVAMAEALLKATAKSRTEQAAAKREAESSPKVAVEVAAPVKTAKPAQLAEPPQVKVRSPRGRRMPDWVVHHPGIVGEVRKFVVEGGPYKTLDECHRALEDKMRSVVQGRVIELVHSGKGEHASVPTLQAMGIGADYILRELCTEEYVETNEYDFGPMLTAHALMEFNAAQDAALVDRWTAYARRSGVERTAFGAGLVVGCLALAFGLLKVDTWTRGYYTKRLFLGVPAAIIAVVALMTLA